MRNNHTSTRQEALAQRPALSRTVLSCLLAVLLALTMMPVAGFGGAAAYAESTADAFAQNGANIIDDASDIPAQGGQPSGEEEGAGDGASSDAQDVPGEPGGGAGEADSGAQDGDNAAAPEGGGQDGVLDDTPDAETPDYTWGAEKEGEESSDDEAAVDARASRTVSTWDEFVKAYADVAVSEILVSGTLVPTSTVEIDRDIAIRAASDGAMMQNNTTVVFKVKDGTSPKIVIDDIIFDGGVTWGASTAPADVDPATLPGGSDVRYSDATLERSTYGGTNVVQRHPVLTSMNAPGASITLNDVTIRNFCGGNSRTPGYSTSARIVVCNGASLTVNGGKFYDNNSVYGASDWGHGAVIFVGGNNGNAKGKKTTLDVNDGADGAAPEFWGNHANYGGAIAVYGSSSQYGGVEANLNSGIWRNNFGSEGGAVSVFNYAARLNIHDGVEMYRNGSDYRGGAVAILDLVGDESITPQHALPYDGLHMDGGRIYDNHQAFRNVSLPATDFSGAGISSAYDSAHSMWFSGTAYVWDNYMIQPTSGKKMQTNVNTESVTAFGVEGDLLPGAKIGTQHWGYNNASGPDYTVSPTQSLPINDKGNRFGLVTDPNITGLHRIVRDSNGWEHETNPNYDIPGKGLHLVGSLGPRHHDGRYQLTWSDHPYVEFIASGGSFPAGTQVTIWDWDGNEAGKTSEKTVTLEEGVQSVVSWANNVGTEENPEWIYPPAIPDPSELGVEWNGADRTLAEGGWVTDPAGDVNQNAVRDEGEDWGVEYGDDPAVPGSSMEADDPRAFYAVWSGEGMGVPTNPDETFTVIYEKGAAGGNPDSVKGDVPVDGKIYQRTGEGAKPRAAESSGLMAAGYVFDGWKVGDKVYQPGDSVLYDESAAEDVPGDDKPAVMRLVAQWRLPSLSEVFYVDYFPGVAPQGETVSGQPPFDGVDSVQKAYMRDGGEATVLGQGSLSVSGDYEFAGWSLVEGADSPDYREGDKVSYDASADPTGTGHIVLHAVWRPTVNADTVFSVERPDLGDRLEFAGANALRDALKAAENYLNGNDPATTGLGILQPVADFFTGYGDDRAMVAAERSEVVIKQWKDYTVPAQATANIPAGKTIVLDGQKGSFDGSGHISIGGAKNFTMVNVAGTGTFETRHVTLTGGKSENKAASKGQMFAVAGKASLILSDGTLLEEGMAARGGGAIFLNRGDKDNLTKLVMRGDARIENCITNGGGGGGVRTDFYTDITLEDTASIVKCETAQSSGEGGGGIYQEENGSLTLKGNALIEECRTNRASDHNGGGGGIYQRFGGSLVLTENAAIRNCGSAFDGGAIFFDGRNNGYLELSGNAEITGCWADQYGAAIHTGPEKGGLVVIKDNVRITDNAVFKSSEYGAILNWYTRIRLEGSPYIWDNTVDTNKDHKGDGVIQSNLRTFSDILEDAQVAGDLTGGKVGISTKYKAKGQQFATAWMPDGMEGALNIGQAGVASDLSGLGHLVNDANSALWGAAGTGSAIVWSDEMTAMFDANGGMFNADGSTLLSKDADGASGAWKTPAAPTNADVTGAPDYQRLVPGNEWNSAKDGSGDVYAAGEPMTAPVTAYAQWEIDPNAEFNLTYDANGGHFGADANDTERAVGPIAWDKQTPPAAPAFGEKPTRDETYTDEQGAEQPRYEFLGWSTSSSLAAKVDFEPGVTQLTSKNQRVYAVWKDNSPDPDDESPWQLYVSEDTGDDTNGNGTQAKPYRTFKQAFEVVHNHASLFSTHGEYADGARPTAAPKDPDYPTLAWATVILMDDWKFGDKTTNAAGNNRGYVAVPQNVLSGSITVRGMDGVKNIALDATTVANVDLFQAPANTKLVLKHLTIDGAGVEGDHQAVYLSGRSDLTLGYGLTLQNWTSTQAPAIHAANMGARNNVNFGEIVMRNNSTIDNCKSTRATDWSWGDRDVSGGAILLRNAGTMIMEKGSAIKNCSSNGTAGAIYLAGYNNAVDAAGNTIGAASLYMMEGSLIDNCTAKTHGGAVYSYQFNDLQIAGTVSNCSAATGGAFAAYKSYSTGSGYHEYNSAKLHGGLHILDGAHIVDCTATGTYINKGDADGVNPNFGEEVGYGGMFAGGQGWGTFMITGGLIERCTAPNGIGGVAASWGWSPYMDDGIIRDCSALAGGAFAIDEGYMFLGGLIEGCKATGEPDQSHNFSSTINGQGGAILFWNEEGGLIMDLTIRNCSATAAGGAMAFPHDYYTPPDGKAKGTVRNIRINHETSFDIYGITIEGCTAPVGAAISLPGQGTGLSSNFRLMDMSRIAPGGAVRAMFNHDNYNKDRVDEILTPKAPIVIDGNYTPDGQPSNVQTLQKRGVLNPADWSSSSYDWLTMITNMNGEPLPGSHIGFTTGYSTADMAKFNKEGDAFARTNKADGSVDFISSLYSDKDASLIPVWGTKADANLVWKQGWAFLFDENKPGEVTEVEGMPMSQHAALENTMDIPQQVPTDATPGTDDADKWVFAGWATSPNGAVEFYPGDVVGPYDNIKAQLDPDGDHRITLYAVWTPPDPELFFTVTYEKGETPDGSPISGTVPVDDNRYYKGPNADGTGEFTVMGNEGDPRLTADGGWRFRGWATESGVDPEANPEKVIKPGSKVSFNEANGQNIANDYGLVTLYAVWGPKAADEWTVTYEKAKSPTVTGSEPADDNLYKKGNPPVSGNENDPYTDGDEAEIKDAGTMQAAGYVLLGWATKDEPERAKFRPGEKVAYSVELDKRDGMEDDNIDLVAVWRADDGRIFTLVETGEGFNDLNTAANDAFQAANEWFAADLANRDNAQIWQHKDFVINNGANNITTNKQAGEVLGTTNTLAGATVKGKTITLASDNGYFDWDEWYAQRDEGTYDDPRHSILRGTSNHTSTFIWHTSGNLVFKDIIIDGQGVYWNARRSDVYRYDVGAPGNVLTGSYDFQGGFLSVGKMAKKDTEPITAVMGEGALMRNGSPGHDFMLSVMIFGTSSSFVMEDHSALRDIDGRVGTPWSAGIGIVSRGNKYASADQAPESGASKMIIRGLVENIDDSVISLGGIDPYNYYLHNPIYIEFSGNAEIAGIKSNIGYDAPLLQAPTNAKLVIGGNASFHDNWTISSSSYNATNPSASRIITGMLSNNATVGISSVAQNRGTIELSGSPQFYNNISSATDPSSPNWNGVGANVDFKVERGNAAQGKTADEYFRVVGDMRVRGEDGSSGPAYVYSDGQLDNGKVMGTAWTYDGETPTTEGYSLEDYNDDANGRWYQSYGQKVADSEEYTGYWHMVNAWNHNYSAEAVPDEAQYPDQSKIRWTDVMKPARVTFDANSPAGLTGADAARFDQETAGLPDLGSFDAWAPLSKDGEPFEQLFRGITPPNTNSFSEIVTEYDLGNPTVVTKKVSVKLMAPKGYQFVGWTTVPNSDDPAHAYDPNAEFKRPGITVYAKWEKLPDVVLATFTKVGADQDTGVYQKLGGATFNVYKFTGNQADLNENTINTDAIKLAGELGGWSNQWLPLLNVNDTPTLGATPKPGAGETLYSFTSSLDAQTMGTVQLSGLVPNQWYMLVETKAPSAAGDSYQMTTGQWAFQVIDDGNGGYTINLDSASPTRVLSKEGTDGQLPPAFAKKLDGVGEGAFCVNVPVFDLPMAGLPFAISMLLLGAVAVAGVVSWSLVKRRKVE